MIFVGSHREGTFHGVVLAEVPEAFAEEDSSDCGINIDRAQHCPDGAPGLMEVHGLISAIGHIVCNAAVLLANGACTCAMGEDTSITAWTFMQCTLLSP